MTTIFAPRPFGMDWGPNFGRELIRRNICRLGFESGATSILGWVSGGRWSGYPNLRKGVHGKLHILPSAINACSRTNILNK